MNCPVDVFWLNIGIVAAVIFCGGLMLLALATHLRTAVMEIVSSVRKTPVCASLVGLALGALVSYAGTKPPAPTTYTVKFELPLAFDPVESLTCETGKVYRLPSAGGVRWKSSVNDRLYDDGMLVFDLAKPGETVTMTAVWE